MRKRERKCIPGIVDPTDLCWNEVEKIDNQLEQHRKEILNGERGCFTFYPFSIQFFLPKIGFFYVNVAMELLLSVSKNVNWILAAFLIVSPSSC